MKTKVNIFIIFSVVFSSTIVLAQTSGVNESHPQQLHCGTDEYYQQQLLKYPWIKARRDSLEEFTKNYILQHSASIPNGNFEDWQNGELKVWKTNSCRFCMGPMNRYVVIPDSTIVHHGRYSAKLINNAYAKNGFPLSIHPSCLQGYIRFDTGTQGFTSIKVELLKKGIVVDSGTWRSESPIKEWTEITIPLTKTTTAIDSALIIIAITGGGAAWADDLFFKR